MQVHVSSAVVSSSVSELARAIGHAKILAVVQKANMLFCGHGRPFLPIGTTLSTQSPHELP
jgi:hypothetical protein